MSGERVAVVEQIATLRTPWRPIADLARMPWLQYVLSWLVMLYAWHQAHFQFEEYWPQPWRTVIRGAMMLAVAIMFLVGVRRRSDPALTRFACLLAITSLFYGFLANLGSDGAGLSYIKAAIVAIALIPVVDDPVALNRFLRANYWLGLVLIALGTVPLLHFFGLATLPHEQVSRVGGGFGRPDLDPWSFGIFGRTESYPQPATNLPRLQGWSSEPLHWSYFVFWTLACWVLLFPTGPARRRQALHVVGLSLILVHLWFLQSTTARIVGILCLLSVIGYRLAVTRLSGPCLGNWLFALLVLVPGLAGPFAIATLDGVEHLILSETVFAEGSNWRGKIDFLELGPALFTRLVPAFDGGVSVSHNLVLDSYLRYGYLLILPLLFQLFVFVRAGMRSASTWMAAAVLIVLFDHTLGVPGTMFLPSAVMGQLLVFAAGLHAWRRAGNR